MGWRDRWVKIDGRKIFFLYKLLFTLFTLLSFGSFVNGKLTEISNNLRHSFLEENVFCRQWVNDSLKFDDSEPLNSSIKLCSSFVCRRSVVVYETLLHNSNNVWRRIFVICVVCHSRRLFKYKNVELCVKLLHVIAKCRHTNVFADVFAIACCYSFKFSSRFVRSFVA